ncbi:MAG TPA: hypothetical protein VLI41_00230 [Phenylobacterium sp.]|uniref:hypothetical protein n=1 Tax=Phenylobacterium sp. TaxID=1871053 RepID=UPI002BB79AA3|nr:hypothetical protein [Phenylobacterium sp.]HSV01603.1 hypothetical protein [Phenylobacterium sp.]
MVGVMLELAEEPRPVRHFYAVGHEDRSRAEWAAIDEALILGAVATSPVDGVEPVEAFARLTPGTIRRMGLAPGRVHPLGRLWPRRWLA